MGTHGLRGALWAMLGPRSGKPLNGLWQAGLCLGVQGCRQMGTASFLIMVSLALLSALAPEPGAITSLTERALGPPLRHCQLSHHCAWAPGLGLLQRVTFVWHPSSPGAPCPAWNPAPAASPSSVRPPRPPLANPTAAPWSPDSQHWALQGSPRAPTSTSV